jgi:hypothetical protein
MNPWPQTRGSDSAPLGPIYLKQLRSCRGGLGVILCGDLQKDLHSSILDFLCCHIMPIGVTLNSITMHPRPEVEAQSQKANFAPSWTRRGGATCPK